MIHCPGCGAGIRFNIESQRMLCEHCKSSYDPAELDDSIRNDAQSESQYDSFVFICPDCGAELITTDENDAIGFCPFCGGASMIFSRMRKQWRPEHIIPFKITKEECKKRYKQEARRSPFTSGKYRNPELIDGFRGIYMPYWSYKALISGSYNFTGVKKGVFRASDYSGSAFADYTVDGYAHDASLAFDDRISESIAPYDIREQKNFAPGYLCGFYADIGDVNQEKYINGGIEFINREASDFIGRDEKISSVGGVRKMKLNPVKLPVEIQSAERVLFPVWFMSYRNKDRVTYAAVNGQTGKVSADLPASPIRIMLAVFLAAAVLAVLMLALPSVKANITLGLSVAALIIGAVVLNFRYKNVVNPRTGLDKTDEAKQFRKSRILFNLLTVIGSGIGLFIAYTDPAYNVVSYSAAIGEAILLFLMMFVNIRFQIAISKRRPPQFDKKGAHYDEN